MILRTVPTISIPGFRAPLLSPSRSIALAARGEVLQQVAELAMDQTVNLTGLTETTVFQLKVQKPSEDAVLSNDTINVTVEIAPEEE